MIPKMKRFVELIIPSNHCNLRCNYCYLAQNNFKSKESDCFIYSASHIRKALSKERLGGVCYINICASGETLIPKETFEIARELLDEGHFVNIITNGTLRSRFQDFEKINPEDRKRMSFMFSLHYFELLERDMLDAFFENYNYVISLGYGCILSMVLTDSYRKVLNDIKQLCIDKTGYYPQLAPARRVETGNKNVRMMTWQRNKYIEDGLSYGSQLFDTFMQFWKVKRNEFCYSGDWLFRVNAANGNMTKCTCDNCPPINIFGDTDKPIPFEAVGNNCKAEFCLNGNAYLAVGVIPEIEILHYGEIRDVKNAEGKSWISEEMAGFLSQRLDESNKKYSFWKRMYINQKYKLYYNRERKKRG